MKVSLSEIFEDPVSYSISDSSWFPVGEGILADSTWAECSLQHRDTNSIDLKGHLTVSISRLCDRCSEPVDYRISEDFCYCLSTDKERLDSSREIECTDDQCITLYLAEPVIDLGEILREQFFLMLPPKVLCCEDCRGICPHCAAALNEGGCDCRNANTDSPFAVLSAWKKQHR